MEIYLIRHTTPKINNGICYGHSDLELAESFESELQLLSPKLPPSFSHVYCSPLQRCLKLANTFKSKIQTDDRLKELNFGDWELKEWKDIPKDKLDQWMENYVNAGPPKGESYNVLAARVQEIFRGIVSQNKTPTAIITHAGPIRVILAQLLNISLEYSFKIKLDYGSVTKISLVESHFSIDYINR